MPKKPSEPKTIEAEVIPPARPQPEASARPTESLTVTKSAPLSFSTLTPVMNLTVAKQRLAEFQEFIHDYLVKDEDYGIIPGTKKPCLFKPGADKLCELYGIADTYPENRIRRVEDWSKEPPLFDYEITCVLIHHATGQVITEGMGSCNSWEDNYRWRDRKKVCPQCNHETIIKGKDEYGGGWLCWKKNGGCGTKFDDGDPAIEDQEVGRVINESVPTLKNTILKMAKKRAKIDATLSGTRSSGVFTQDLDDIRRATAAEEESHAAAEAPDREADREPKLKKIAGTVTELRQVEAGDHFVLILKVSWKQKKQGKNKKWTTITEEVIVVAETGPMMKALEGTLKSEIEVMCSAQSGAKDKKYWRIEKLVKGGNRAAFEQDKQDLKPGDENRGHGQEGTQKPQESAPAPAGEKPDAETKPPVPAAERPTPGSSGPIPTPPITKIVRNLTVGGKKTQVTWLQVTGQIVHLAPIRKTKQGSEYMTVVLGGFPDFQRPENQKGQHDTFHLRHKHLFEAMGTAHVGDKIVFEFEPETTKEQPGVVWQNIEDLVWINSREYLNGKEVMPRYGSVPK